MSPSRLVNERQPLLGLPIAEETVDTQLNSRAATQAVETSLIAKRESWKFLWYLFLVTSAGVIMTGIIKGFVQNNDVDVGLVTHHLQLGYLFLFTLWGRSLTSKRFCNMHLVAA